MSDKEKVFEVIDERIEELNRKINHFEKFGNQFNHQELIKQAMNISLKSELLWLKNQLTYVIDWRDNDANKDIW